MTIGLIPHRCDYWVTAEGIRILGPRIVDGAKTGADLAEPPDDPETATPSPTSIGSQLEAHQVEQLRQISLTTPAVNLVRAKEAQLADWGHSARMAWPPPRAASLAPAPSDCRCPLNGGWCKKKAAPCGVTDTRGLRSWRLARTRPKG